MISYDGELVGDLGVGCWQDTFDARDVWAEDRIGKISELDPTATASMAEFRVGRLYQGGANSCVANAIARGIDMLFRSRGVPDPPFASRRLVYFNARRAEAREAALRGEEPGPMMDRGSYFRLAMRAVQKLGFCDEAFYPYSDLEEKINETPPPMVYQNAIDQATLRYSRVPTLARVAACAEALRKKIVPVFGMKVDRSFTRNRGELITNVDFTDLVGGHAMTVVEVNEVGIVVDNFWTHFGDSNGYGYLSHALFESSTVFDCYLLEHADDFSTRAA